MRPARPTLARLALCATLTLLAAPLAAQESSAAAVSASSDKPAPRAPSAAAPKAAPQPSPAAPVDPRASSPRRALAAYLKACESGDFVKAAESLDLHGLPRGREVREGPELAAMLHRVLSWHLTLDLESVPDEPVVVGPEGFVLDTVVLEGEEYPIALTPVKQANGETRWFFSRKTVSEIRTLYDANQRRAIEDAVPEWLRKQLLLGMYPWQWLGLVLLFGVAYLIGRVLGSLVTKLLLRLTARLSKWTDQLVRGVAAPARLALATATFVLSAPYLLLMAPLRAAIERASTILFVVSVAWAVSAVVRVATGTWEELLPDDTHGGLESRGLRTRLAMLRRVVTVVVGLIAAGVILMQFEVVRSIGVSLLASAGIAGVLVGFAAQRTLGGIISGIEMSITQPLRLGDIVVFRPGEQGVVERIYFTYVIIRLWDDRRLIVPVNRVMSEPFENWTRTDPDLLAPVELFLDYAAPMDEVRRRFEELCKAHEAWDGRVCRVEVIEATERALRVRGMASVDSVAKAYGLRCDLREGWIAAIAAMDEGRFLPLGRVGTSGPEKKEEAEDSKLAVPKPASASSGSVDSEAAPASQPPSSSSKAARSAAEASAPGSSSRDR